MTMQANTIWELPTEVVEHYELRILPRRVIELDCWVEGDDGGEEKHTLRFENVWSYKCTYFSACPADFIHMAYQKLVDFSGSEQLEYLHQSVSQAADCRAFAIYFDEGSLYEIYAHDVQIVTE